MDIDGADQTTCTMSKISLADHNTQLRCVVTNTKEALTPAETISDVAILTVQKRNNGGLTGPFNTQGGNKNKDGGVTDTEVDQKTGIITTTTKYIDGTAVKLQTMTNGKITVTVELPAEANRTIVTIPVKKSHPQHGCLFGPR